PRPPSSTLFPYTTLFRSQLRPSMLTAADDWVRGCRPGTPRRTSAQLRQLQFHCGKPPPAAEPNTLIIITSTHACRLAVRSAPEGLLAPVGRLARNYNASVQPAVRAVKRIAWIIVMKGPCWSPTVAVRQSYRNYGGR